MSSLLHFPWVNPKFPASPLWDWGKDIALWASEYIAECLAGLGLNGELWQRQCCKILQYFEYISMQLAHTHNPCVYYSHSVAKALILGNISSFIWVQTLILSVMISCMGTGLRGAGLFWRNEDACGAGRISCFWGSSERMLWCTPKHTNLFNAVAIFIDAYAAHDGLLIIRDFIYATPDHLKGRFWHYHS